MSCTCGLLLAHSGLEGGMNDGVGTKQNLLIAHGGLEGGKQLIGRVETKQKRFFQLSDDI